MAQSRFSPHMLQATFVDANGKNKGDAACKFDRNSACDAAR